jgi:hypothetical protein
MRWSFPLPNNARHQRLPCRLNSQDSWRKTAVTPPFLISSSWLSIRIKAVTVEDVLCYIQTNYAIIYL